MTNAVDGNGDLLDARGSAEDCQGNFEEEAGGVREYCWRAGVSLLVEGQD